MSTEKVNIEPSSMHVNITKRDSNLHFYVVWEDYVFIVHIDMLKIMCMHKAEYKHKYEYQFRYKHKFDCL